MTVLTVSNPFFPIGPSGTGAEQIASLVETAVVARGWRSLVIAAEGSYTAGHLVENLPRFMSADVRSAFLRVRSCMTTLSSTANIIHFHGLQIADFVPRGGSRLLATLHAPRSYYPTRMYDIPGLNFVAVSNTQALTLSDIPGLRVIQNGIDVLRYLPRPGRRRGMAFIGRICPEKGVDIALQAAHELDLPLIVAGPIPSFGGAQEYFDRVIQPLLDSKRTFVGPVDVKGKVEILASVRCLLVPTCVPETSSLVAMEAIACGVPVVALRSGALPEVVEHGVTGVLARSPECFAKAVKLSAHISPAKCRKQAELRFDSRRMVSEYFDVYNTLLKNAT